jgi:UDP-N-acetylmuramyl pentapeptide phosphotransferase/UDP-N-acetylglucosamine-1-phosphate transferase
MAAPLESAGSAILFLAAIAAALLSAAGIVALKPLLVRYALARPNARSSHKVPTPQGGGIAVVGASLVAAGAILATFEPSQSFLVAAAAAIGLALVGAVDDIRPLPAGFRLLLQVAAVATVVAAGGGRVLPGIPLLAEQAILTFGGVWFVNLVNFMDGLDWITVAEMVPITAFIALLWFTDVVPAQAAVVGAALCGALLGFAPFNSPSRASSSATWAPCPSGCWWAGCSCTLPAAERSPPHCCCRSTISWTPPSPCCAASGAGSGCGRPTAAISTRRPPTTASRRFP